MELTTCWTLGFASLVLFPVYIRNRVFTTPEFLEARFHPLARILFSALMLIISITTKMAFHLYAGALVLNAMVGWNVMSVVWIMGTIAALVTIIGGFTAVAYTDGIQAGIIIAGCMTMTLVGLHKVGGWHALTMQVPQAIHMAKPYYDPNYPFWGVLVTAIYGGTFYWGVDQVNVQRVLGARDLQQARWGAMFTILLKFLPVFIFALPGVIARALYPGRDPKTTFVTLMNGLLPTGIRGLVLAALFASLIGSTLSVMNSVSTLVARDFVLRFRPDTDERTQVRYGRFAIVAAAFLGVMAAYAVYKTPDGLYKYLQAVSLYLALPVAPAIVFGILSKRVTVAGAFAAAGVGSVCAFVFVTDQLIGPHAGSMLFPWIHTGPLTINYTYRGLWGSIASVVTLFVVSSVTKKADPKSLDRLTVNWRGVWERFRGVADWRLQLAVLTAITGVLYWALA